MDPQNDNLINSNQSTDTQLDFSGITPIETSSLSTVTDSPEPKSGLPNSIVDLGPDLSNSDPTSDISSPSDSNNDNASAATPEGQLVVGDPLQPEKSSEEVQSAPDGSIASNPLDDYFKQTDTVSGIEPSPALDSQTPQSLETPEKIESTEDKKPKRQLTVEEEMAIKAHRKMILKWVFVIFNFLAMAGLLWYYFRPVSQQNLPYEQMQN